MHLITMAHLGEAQGVIEQFKLKRTQSNLFQNGEMVLVLTGEGPFEAATSTALILGQFQFKEVINLGIAGTLSDKLSIGDIYPIRTHYLIQDTKPTFKSFSSINSGPDCLTTFERILNPERVAPLKGLGHIVDREAWGVAYAAKMAGVSFRSFKLISDLAGTIGACEAVKEEAPFYAAKLATFLGNDILEKKTEEFQIPSLKDIHFTFTTSHRFKNLLKKLAIKNEGPMEEILKSLPIEDLQKIKMSPKERAGILLEHMENELDPIRKNLLKAKTEWLKELHGTGITVQTDPNWEGPEISIHFNVETDQELKQKLEVLQKFSVTPFRHLMEGKIHVE